MNTLLHFGINTSIVNFFFFFIVVFGIIIPFFYSIVSNSYIANKIFFWFYWVNSALIAAVIFGGHLSFSINVEREYYPDYLDDHEIEEISIRSHIIAISQSKIKVLNNTERLSPYLNLDSNLGNILLKDISIRVVNA